MTVRPGRQQDGVDEVGTGLPQLVSLGYPDELGLRLGGFPGGPGHPGLQVVQAGANGQRDALGVIRVQPAQHQPRRQHLFGRDPYVTH